MERKTAAVIFGGQSSEHEVSCMSAANVIDRINKEKYDLLLIGITMDGHWIKTDSVDDIRSGEWRNGKVSAAILPDATKKCAILMDGDKVTAVTLDLVFPVLHGLHGEDGTIQGLLELARIPYVGLSLIHIQMCIRDRIYTPNQLHYPDESVIGKNLVNPIGMIAAAAQMLRLSFGLEAEAGAIEEAQGKAQHLGCSRNHANGIDHIFSDHRLIWIMKLVRCVNPLLCIT